MRTSKNCDANTLLRSFNATPAEFLLKNSKKKKKTFYSSLVISHRQNKDDTEPKAAIFAGYEL